MVPSQFDATQVTRPAPVLMFYYVLVALLTVAGFPLVIWPLLFKYQTLQYRFDDEGLSMSWGILFRREIYLTYRRIQDIHVTRNLLQRWLGLATISIQTASGSATPEMAVEGILEAEQLRDYLYGRMRGERDETLAEAPSAAEPADEALQLLREIREGLQRLFPSLPGPSAAGPGAAGPAARELGS